MDLLSPFVRIVLALGLTVMGTGCGSTRPTREHFVDEGALGPYSSAVRAGSFVFVSGKIGDRSGTFEQEVETAIDAVVQALDLADLALEDVVSVTVYLTDIANYSAFNEVYARRLEAPHPARACVAVNALPGMARCEIQVTARLP